MATTQDASVGIGVESTFKTTITPTRWYEFTDLNLDYKPERKQGKGLRVTSRYARSARRVTTQTLSEGSLTLEAVTKGMGLLLQAALGSGTSTLVSGTTYQQVFTDGDAPNSLTVQMGLPREDGTIDPYTFPGCVVTNWSLTAAKDEIVTMKFDLDGGGLIDTSTALTAVSYPSAPNLFHFAQGSLVASGGSFTAPTTTALASYASSTTLANFTEFELESNNNLTGGETTLGSAGVRSTKPRPGLREGKGKFKAIYTDTVQRTNFINDTEFGVILTFTTTESLSTGFATMQVIIPAIKLDGGLPNPNGGDVPEFDGSFTILDNLSAAHPIWIVLRTGDTAL